MAVGSLNLSRRDLLIVVALFALSRLLYAWLGLRFDASTLPAYMQFIDVPLLRDRLAESLWYYHANPPMLNLLTGVALKLFGSQGTLVLAALFHLLGLLLAISVYGLACRLARSRLAALITAGLLVFSPAFVLYENWLMYSFPAVTLLTLSALALYQYVYTLRTGWCVAFFALLAALLLTRSLFHLAWMVLIGGLLGIALREQWRQVLKAAIIPLLAVVLWYGKNYYLFGFFGASSWTGLGLSNITTLVPTRDELRPLVEDGRLSKYALVSRYAQLDQLFAESKPPTGIPVLDEVTKSTGHYNFNNHQIVEINRHYTADALTVMRTYPFSHVIGVVIANRLFFSPANMNLYFTENNRAAVRPMEAVFNPLLYGVGRESRWLTQPHFGFDHNAVLEVNTSVPLIVTWCLVLGYGYHQLRQGLLSKVRSELPRALVIGFIVITALYLYVIGTTLELAENYRYRYLIEPLFLVLTASGLTALVRTVGARYFPKAATAVASMNYADPPPDGKMAVSKPWTFSRSLRYALVSAAMVAVPGFILYSQLLAIFAGAVAEPGITMGAADRDFANYWTGARLVLEGLHQDLWVQETYFKHLQGFFGPDTPWRNWGYPPHFLLLIWPLGWLAYEPAMATFLLVTLALFIAAALQFRRACTPQSDWRILALALLSFCMMMLDTAQNGFLTAALMLFGLAWRKERPMLAGLMFALLTVKPQLGLLIPVLLAAERRWAVVAWTVAGALALVAASALIFGASSWSAYLTETVAYQRSVMTNGTGIFLAMMPTVFGGMRALEFLHETASSAQWPISLAGAVVLSYLLFTEKDDVRRAFFAVAGVFIISPYAFNYDMGALVVLAAVLAGSQQLRRAAAIAVGSVATSAAAVMYFGMADMPFTPLLLLFSMLALALDSKARTAVMDPGSLASTAT